MRKDFERVVKPFFDKIRNFDSVIHGKLSDFLLENYGTCLALKSEYVDYSFVPSGLDPLKIKLKEDMLIATYAFRIAVSEVFDCADSDMIEIYDVFQVLGDSRGWSRLEFDKQCLNLMGVEVRKRRPPLYLPSIQSGSDYN